jgi:hypothetical protein
MVHKDGGMRASANVYGRPRKKGFPGVAPKGTEVMGGWTFFLKEASRGFGEESFSLSEYTYSFKHVLSYRGWD